jgi:hypothetical protein
MPTSPFNSPLAFDYKPLGLEAFAKPLSEMQKGYDETQSSLSAATYDINALTKDKKTKDKIIDELNAKRDEIATNLMTSKNYRQASKQLTELNKLYKEHPEIQALNAEHKATMDWIKEGDEQAKKGDINKEYWEAQKANKLAEYEGLSYNPEDKSYTSVNRQNLGKDLEKEIQDRMLEIGKATPEQMKDIATQHGMDLTNFQWVTSDGSINYKAIDELKKNISQNILNQPRYTQYLNEVAGVKAETERFRNPENYESWKESQYLDHLQEIDTKIKHTEESAASGNKEAKAYLKSSSFKDLIESRNNLKKDIEEGNLSTNKAEQIYKNNYTTDYVNKNSRETADIFDYYKKEMAQSWSNMSNAQLGAYGIGEDGKEIKTESTITPDMYGETYTTKSLGEQYTNHKNNMIASTTEINKLTNGVFNIAFKPGQGKGQYNVYMQTKEANAIYNASAGAKDYNDFVKKYKQFGGTATDGRVLGTFFTVLKDPSNLKNFQRETFNLNENAKDLSIVSGIYNKSIENMQGSNDYKTVMSTIGNTVGFQDVVVTGDSEGPANDPVWKKAASMGLTTYNKRGHISSITFDNYAKAAGFKNAADALEHNFTFPKYMKNITENHFGDSGPLAGVGAWTGSNINSTYNLIKENLLNKNLTKSSFGAEFHVLGTNAASKELESKTNAKIDAFVGATGNHIENMKPLFGDSWKSNPAFDFSGKFIGKKTGKAVLGMTGDQVYFSIPVSYTDAAGVERQTTIKALPRTGTTVSGELKGIVLEVAKNAKNQKDKDMAANALFSLEHPYSNINESYVNSLQTNATDPIEIYQFNYNGTKIRAMKESLNTAKSKGHNNQFYTAQYFDGKNWKDMPDDDGSPISTSDITTLRSKLGGLYVED